MNKKEMNFSEIQANKEAFLRQYEVAEQFPKCGVSWETLMEIGEDYEMKCFGDGRETQEYKGEYFDIIQGHIAKISCFGSVHSYRFRIKKTGSLLAKIIRKGAERGEIYTASNYFHKITDLLGIRILYVFKEDYWPVHQQIMAEYENQLAQDISVKLKEGDDKEMYAQLLQKHSNVRVDENKTYRSIHYTIYARKNDITACPRVEIQTRTVFEEGWSEINHKLVYKKGKRDLGLKKTSDVLSSMVGACDAIGGLMKGIYDTTLQFDSGAEQDNEEVLHNDDNSVLKVIQSFLLQ